MACLVRASIAGVASSSTSTRGFVRTALARGDPLPLLARHGEAALADDGVIAVRKPAMKRCACRVGHDRRVLDLLHGRGRTAEGDVLPNRRGEQTALLEDQSDGRSHRGERVIARVAAVDADCAGRRVVEPG